MRRFIALVVGLAWLFACGLGLWWCAHQLSLLAYAGLYTGGQLTYWFLKGLTQGLGRRKSAVLPTGASVHVDIDATVVDRVEFNDGWMYQVEGDDGRCRWVPDYNVEPR